MTIRVEVGDRVGLHVSDPWEFVSECGDSAHGGVVSEVKGTDVLVDLERPIAFRGVNFVAVIATARHAPPVRVDGAYPALAVNLLFCSAEERESCGLTRPVVSRGLHAIGSVEFRR